MTSTAPPRHFTVPRALISPARPPRPVLSWRRWSTSSSPASSFTRLRQQKARPYEHQAENEELQRARDKLASHALALTPRKEAKRTHTPRSSTLPLPTDAPGTAAAPHVGRHSPTQPPSPQRRRPRGLVHPSYQQVDHGLWRSHTGLSTGYPPDPPKVRLQPAERSSYLPNSTAPR